jgi:hypothetical protein
VQRRTLRVRLMRAFTNRGPQLIGVFDGLQERERGVKWMHHPLPPGS